jgi:hypothetical protein
MARTGLGLPGWYASSQTILMARALLVLLPLFCSVQPEQAGFAIYCTAGVQPSAQRPIIVGSWFFPFARPFALLAALLRGLFAAIANICITLIGLAAETAHSGNKYDLSV